MRKITYLILHLLFTLGLQAQSLQIYPVSMPDPMNFGGKIICIFQDKMGFMWLGKDSGLFRFDGNELKAYRNDPFNAESISSNYVQAIAEDASGDIWVGTKGGGLNRLNRKTGVFNHFIHNTKDQNSISFDEIRSICPDGNGNFWIGTDGGGLDYLNAKTGKFQHFTKGLRSKEIQQVVSAGVNKYWISTVGGGLHLFDSKTGRFYATGQGTRYEKSNVFAVKEVKPGVLWVAALEDGLLAYNIKNDRFSTVVPNDEYVSFKKIALTTKGEIYAGCYTGLLYFSNANSTYRPVEATDPLFKTIIEIFIDRTQTIWLGAGDGVVGKINSFRKPFHTYPTSSPLKLASAHSLVFDKETHNLYMALMNQLVKSNVGKTTHESTKIPLLYGSSLVDIPDEKALLCSTSQGLMLFNKKSRAAKRLAFANKADAGLFYKDIRSIYANDTSGIWIAGLSSTYKICRDKKAGNWKIEKAIPIGVKGGLSKSHFSSCFLKTKGGDFFIGTFGGGLNWLKHGESKFRYLMHDRNNKNSLSNNFVEYLVEDAKGNVWVGTQSGLNKLNIRTGVFSQLLMGDGLADDWISAIAIDRLNRVWISSQQGISSVSEDMQTIRNYDIYDGLPSNRFLAHSVTTDHNGQMYFGSKRGVVWFHPDSIRDNPHLSQAAIVDFKINDKVVEISSNSPLTQSIELANDINLAYKQNSFSFELAALSYFNPKRNKIKYKLIGYDTNWKLCGVEKVVTYSEIPSGTYTFSVLAANEDGVWNTIPKNIKITISRPPWLSGWALLIYALLIAGSLYIHSAKKKKTETTQLVASANRKNIQPSPLNDETADVQFLQKVLSIVEENMKDSNFGVDELCEKMHLSRPQLYRKFRSNVGIPISEFIKEVRLKRAAQLLLLKPESISEVAYQVGFTDPRYFRKCFKQQFGVAPTQYTSKL